MKKFLSTKYSAGAFNFAMLVLRLALGILMLHHGYDKLIHFTSYKTHFLNFLGLGSTLSLALDIFAEFFCSMFVILGLFTRLAVIPIAIAMCVALFKAHGGDLFGAGERAAIYLACCIVLLFVGAGRMSVDGVIGK
ncbi:MAG TPA: DoxX family protein [Chitinophagaceae bacterium]|nr:DoxX family protein [Chitinophagaceae bacterium]